MPRDLSKPVPKATDTQLQKTGNYIRELQQANGLCKNFSIVKKLYGVIVFNNHGRALFRDHNGGRIGVAGGDLRNQ